MNVLDHVMIGANTLQAGIDFVTKTFDATPVYAGAHKDIGTCNALTGFKSNFYLEVLAPDPENETNSPFRDALFQITEPRIFTYIVRTDNINDVAERADALGIGVVGPKVFERTTPDGIVLRWSLLFFKDHEFGNLLPTVIDWQNVPMPGTTLPPELSLDHFAIETPHHERLKLVLGRLKVDVTVVDGASAQVTLSCSGQHGSKSLHCAAARGFF